MTIFIKLLFFSRLVQNTEFHTPVYMYVSLIFVSKSPIEKNNISKYVIGSKLQNYDIKMTH